MSTLILKKATSDFKIEVARSAKAIELLISLGATPKEADGSKDTFIVEDPCAVRRVLEKAGAFAP